MPIVMLPMEVHWQMERDIALKAPLLYAMYRNTTLVPPHILFPALEQFMDEKGKRDFLVGILDDWYRQYINRQEKLN